VARDFAYAGASTQRVVQYLDRIKNAVDDWKGN
jgi:hypothetical protein